MPVPDYVSLPGPSAPSTSTQEQQTDSSDIPPPPPPFPGTEGAVEEETDAEMTSTDAAADVPAQATGSKRKAEADTVGEEQDGGKAARTDTATAGSVHRIFTVLRKEDLAAPQLPSLQELEKFLVDKQKQELLSEYV